MPSAEPIGSADDTGLLGNNEEGLQNALEKMDTILKYKCDMIINKEKQCYEMFQNSKTKDWALSGW